MEFARALAVAAGLLLALLLPWPVGADAHGNPSWSQLEERAHALDQRVIELQHEIMAARHDGDQATVERAQKDLKTVQEQRVESLRALGQLR